MRIPGLTLLLLAVLVTPARADTLALDTTAPRLRVGAVPKPVTRAAFNAGVTVRVSADEPIAAELSLLAGSPPRLVAGHALALAPGTRTVTLEPVRKLRGSRPVRAYVRVVAIDSSANPSAKTVSFSVR